MKKDENNLDNIPLFMKIIMSAILIILFVIVTYISIVYVVPISLFLAIVLIVCINIITSIGYFVVFIYKKS